MLLNRAAIKLFRIKSCLIIFYSFISFIFYSDDIYTHFVQVYGEGPIGQYIVNFTPKDYTKEDSVSFARKEIMEFLSGMIYGYNFIYKVENNITGSNGYFDLVPLVKLSEYDKNIKITQLQEANISMRFQATYRLNDDQKNFIKGFQSVIAKMSSGSSTGSFPEEEWENRINVYKDALRDAVLNGAKKDLKSRPNFIKGRILLAESPKFSIISGDWRAIVKIHLIINEVTYNDTY